MPKYDPESGKLHLELKRELKAALERAARLRGVSNSQACREAITYYVYMVVNHRAICANGTMCLCPQMHAALAQSPPIGNPIQAPLKLEDL